ncbi:MAG: DNA translocase FtsK [Bacteroidales bacterium]|jgi:S-DNA-T family DNA segregation ATPase FtsK/SpoIIIE|nr:DNA translocase FtsK [Bacteroidales bacterium]
MAKKSASQNRSSEKSISIRFIIGLVFHALGIATSLAFISFIWCGGADRSIFDLSLWELLTNSDIVVYNWLGKYGAWFSDMAMTNGIGIMAFAIPIVMFAVGLWTLGIRTFSMRKLLWRTFLIAIWGSITLGFVFFSLSDKYYMLLGGAHGHYIAKWLMSSVGIMGTILILCITLVIYLSVHVSGFRDKVVALISKVSSRDIKLPSFSYNNGEGDEWNGEASTPEVVAENKAKTQEDEEIVTDNKIVDDVQQESEEELSKDEEPEDVDEKSDEKSDDGMTIERPTDSEKHEDFDILRQEDEDEFKGKPHTGLDEPYDPKADLSNYKLPTLDLLDEHISNNEEVSDEELLSNKNIIVETLDNFSIKLKSIKATVGPTVTLYEIVPAPGIKISKIQSLENDIALSLAALGIRIVAPIPGKGTIGIEVPNSKPQIVSMVSLLKSSKFQTSTAELPIAIGKTISNEPFIFDLAKTPHLLVAGATGQGKSVCLNAIVTSLLYKMHPSQLKFVMVDPKKVEFSIYSNLENHFIAKMPEQDNAIITDDDNAKAVLNSLTTEMEDRYALLEKAKLRNIKEYNQAFISRRLNPEHGHKFLPYIVVIIDEYGDLMMTAGKDIELPIARIAQKARAVGIHMIIATQRPAATIVTGNIKANFPSRISCKVSAMVDSRTILDASGAQNLIGRGDMLVSIAGGSLTRVQCAFVDTPEVCRINDYIAGQQGYPIPYELPEPRGIDNDSSDGGFESGDTKAGKFDPLFCKVAEMIVNGGDMASTSNIQRQFELGYNRAGKIMDQMERVGIVGPQIKAGKPRQVRVHTLSELEDIIVRFNIPK